MDFNEYRSKYFTDPAPEQRFSFQGIRGAAVYYQQPPQTEAKKIFEEKYKEAIENKTASNNSSSTNSIKPVHAKIVAPTNIHPQHKSQTIKAVPSQQYVTSLNNNNNNNNTNTNIT